jgi:cob(I)alamin adenosyltransferase
MALMDTQQLTSQMKIHGDALGTLAKFANEVADDNAKLQDELVRLKAWIRATIMQTLDEAKSELIREVHAISAEAVNEARARARRAEKECADLEELLTKPGTMRAVKLVHDAEGKTLGAVICDRT